MSRTSLLLVWTTVFFLSTPVQAQDLFKLLFYDIYFMQQESYLYDLIDDWDWYTADKGLRSTAGSFTNKLFYFDLDTRINHQFSPWLRFGYRRHQEDSVLFDNLDHYAWLSLAWNRWSLGLIGMVEGKKQWNDVGFLMEYRWSPTQRIGFSYIVQEPWYNSKNFDRTSYLSLPRRYEIDAAWNSGRLCFAGHGRLTSKYKFDNSNAIEEQWSGVAQFIGLARWNEREHLGIELHWIRHHEDLFFYDQEQLDSENLHSYRLMVEFTRAVVTDLLFRLRAGWALSTGNDYDSPRPELSVASQPYNFHRSDLILVTEADYFLGTGDSLRLGFVSDLVDREAPGSSRLKPLDDKYLLKVTGHYRRVFGNRGDLVFLLSYHLTRRDFGGGNLRLTVWL